MSKRRIIAMKPRPGLRAIPMSSKTISTKEQAFIVQTAFKEKNTKTKRNRKRNTNKRKNRHLMRAITVPS